MDKICLTEGCNNYTVKYKRYCSKCRNKKFREDNPIKYLFNNKKKNAKDRE